MSAEADVGRAGELRPEGTRDVQLASCWAFGDPTIDDGERAGGCVGESSGGGRGFAGWICGVGGRETHHQGVTRSGESVEPTGKAGSGGAVGTQGNMAEETMHPP